jgi:hypothetical protein
MVKAKISGILVGVAGEYYVAAELSRKGYVASITLRNTRGIDIVVSNEDGNKTVNIQVKTKREGISDWIMSKKAEDIRDKNMFYVFVSLIKEEKRTEFHIVPSIIVSDYVTKEHSDWLKAPGRNGRMHNDTNMRIFADLEKKYLERWDLLGLD